MASYSNLKERGWLSPDEAASLRAMWQPISTLERIGTDIILWNPCDGVHTLNITIAPSDLEKLKRGGVFTHWQAVTPPDQQSDGGPH